MAYLANSIYQANPDVIGVDKEFKLDKSVKEYKVSDFTGAKPGGRMTVNNTTFNIPSNTVTSYWAKGGPSKVSLRFGIGGTDANYVDYWKTAIPRAQTNTRRR
jgi:penicillin-binding protein